MRDKNLKIDTFKRIDELLNIGFEFDLKLFSRIDKKISYEEVKSLEEPAWQEMLNSLKKD
jgi:hypothetical protein